MFRNRCRTLLNLLLATVLAAVWTSPASAWVRDAYPLWADGNIDLYLDLPTSPTYTDASNPYTAAEAAIGRWNPLTARVQIVARNGASVSDTGRSTVRFASTVQGAAFGPGVLAVTLVKHDGTKRTEADIILNSNANWDSYSGYSSINRPNLRRVLTHELGHLLGLGHPNDAGQQVASVMDSTAYHIHEPAPDDADAVGEFYGYTTANPGRPPVFNQQVYSRSVLEGASSEFSVNAYGAMTITYQWYKDAVALPGATSATYRIPKASLAHAGDYYAVATNKLGSVTSTTARLTVTPATPPTINTNGRATSVSIGGRISFSASSSGSSPITFQWYRNGAPISGATSYYLELTPVTAADAGTYHVVATNIAGSATSSSWIVTVTPLPPPVITISYAPAAVTLTPNNPLSLNPVFNNTTVPTTYQWFRDGRPLAGQTTATLVLPYSPDLVGDYNLVATNATGSTVGPVQTVQLGSATASTGGWTTFLRDDRRLYFLFDNPARIERFNLETGAFETPITLARSSTTLTLHQGNLYYTAGRTVRRMKTDGTADEFLTNTSADVVGLVAVGNFLYVRFSDSYAELFGLNLASRTTFTTTGGYTVGGAFSVAPSLGRLFTRTIGLSPGDIGYATFKSDGTIATRADSPYHGDFPNGSKTWVIAREAAVIDNSGTIYRTDNLNFVASVGSFVDVAETEQNQLMVLRGATIDRVDAAFRAVDQLKLGTAADAIATRNGRLFVFRQPTGPGTNLTAEELNLSGFASPQPGPAFNPAGVDPVIEKVFQDNRGNLLLYSRLYRSVYVWSVADHAIIKNIPLLGPATYLTYSPAWDRLLLGYSNGNITQLSPSDAAPRETLFARAPVQVLGLAAAGEHLLLIDPSGAWVAYYTYNRDGTIIGRRDWSYESRTMTWNAASGRMYQFKDSSSPNDLIYTTIKADGTFGEMRDSPYHGEISTVPPIILSPNGDQVLVGSGVFFNADSLSQSNALASNLDAGTWLGGRLYTALTTLDGVRLTRWGGTNYQADATALAPGYQPNLFTTSNGRLAMTTLWKGQLVVSVFDTDLNPVSRYNHRGIDLLKANARLINLSTRVSLDPTDGPLIVGLVVGGTGPVQALIRAVGPQLAQYGVNQPLSDPRFAVYDSKGRAVATNDDWSSVRAADQQVVTSTTTAVGAFPLTAGSRDAATVLTLTPGAYTVHTERSASATGQVVLVEIYDASAQGSGGRLVNLSSRAPAGEGNSSLITGFVIGGDIDQEVLLRGVGPSLTRFGVANALSDPRLTLRQGESTFAENDNWAGNTRVSTAIRASGAFEFESANSRDAAVVTPLAPGAYTAQVTPAPGSIKGTALIEVYEIDP